MICKFCNLPNRSGACYCANCGQALPKESTSRQKALLSVIACLLIAVVGIGIVIPQIRPDNENVSTNEETSENKTVEIKQVLPLAEGAVGVLYTDGTVRVSGNPAFAESVSDWNQITQLYSSRYSILSDGPILAGLTESGEIFTTAGNIPGWSNVKTLYFSWRGIVGVTHDGKALTYGDWEGDMFFCNLSDVEALANVGDEWGCLKKDGSVIFNYDMSGYSVAWENVKELRASDHGFYAIMKDGTVKAQFEDSCDGLTGAVKVVDFEDWLFGISEEGKLLTQNGGNIYTNTGDMVVDMPGLPYFGEEIDIAQFSQLEDIIPCRGLILIKKDGTAEHIGANPWWDLSHWHSIRKVCGIYTMDSGPILYGIQEDGSVITHWYDEHQEQYRDWQLQDIYPGIEGVVGLTLDGKLVGDGIYKNLDFSVFE